MPAGVHAYGRIQSALQQIYINFIVVCLLSATGIWYNSPCVKEDKTMAQVNFRIEDNLKAEADYIFGRIGLSMSAALNIFLRQVVDHRGIPFEVRIRDTSLSSPEGILQAARDYENGKKNYHFHELPAMLASTDSSRAIRRSRRAKTLV